MDQIAQPAERSEILNFNVRLIVAGSRGYNNYDEFSAILKMFVEDLELKHPGEPILFITGRAKNGPDNMVIQWCVEHERPWVEYPADWDQFGKRAGYIRNTEMAEVGTDLIVFWDGKTKGSMHMYETGVAKELHVLSVLIKLDEGAENGGKQRSF